MRRLSYQFLLLFLLTGQSMLSAQNLSTDFKNMYTYLVQQQNVRMQAQILVYTTDNPNTPSTTQNIFMLKNHNKYYYHVDSVEMILNADGLLIVDHDARSLILQKDQTTNKGNYDFDEFTKYFQSNYNIDSAVATLEDAEFISSENGVNSYRMEDFDEMITTAIIGIDMNKHFYSDLTYYYNTDMFPGVDRVKIYFTEFTNTPSINQDYFAMDKFIEIEGNEYTINPEYLDYHFETNP